MSNKSDAPRFESLCRVHCISQMFRQCNIRLYKLYYKVKMYYTIPAAALMRRRYCLYVGTIPGLPVYLYKCEKDLRLGQFLFESSIKFLDEQMPVWGERLRQSINYVVICDNVDLMSYRREQGCLYVNPWTMVRRLRSAQQPSIPIRLASFLVQAACTAFLWERHAQYMHPNDCKILTYKARVRFLLRCLPIRKNPGTLSLIRQAKTESEYINIGITRDAMKNDPSISGIIAGIQVAEQHIAEARAARKVRVDSKRVLVF